MPTSQTISYLTFGFKKTKINARREARMKIVLIQKNIFFENTEHPVTKRAIFIFSCNLFETAFVQNENTFISRLKSKNYRIQKKIQSIVCLSKLLSSVVK